MKECSIETGDAGEYISFLCRSSGMSNEIRCLESLGLLKTKNMFPTRALECLADFFFVLSCTLASAGYVGFERHMLELPNSAVDLPRSKSTTAGLMVMEMPCFSPCM